MGSKEEKLETESCEKIFQIFKEFFVGVTKIEELGAVGSKLLNGVQQGLEFIRRPPINHTSILLRNIIKNNETKRFQSYLGAGCIKCEDRGQNMSQLKNTLNELECLMKNATAALQTAIECSMRSRNNDITDELDQQAPGDRDETTLCREQCEITDYAAMMGIIYSMLKQDYVMQKLDTIHSYTVGKDRVLPEHYDIIQCLRKLLSYVVFASLHKR